MWSIKEKKDSLDFIKSLKPHFAKNTVKRIKIQNMYWKKIFAKYMFDKGLLSKIHRGLLKLNNKKILKIDLKMDKRSWHISHKIIYRCKTSIWRYTHHHSSLKNFELNLQWVTTRLLLEWLKWKRPTYSYRLQSSRGRQIINNTHNN